jgi:hypothetical protein
MANLKPRLNLKLAALLQLVTTLFNPSSLSTGAASDLNSSSFHPPDSVAFLKL